MRLVHIISLKEQCRTISTYWPADPTSAALYSPIWAPYLYPDPQADLQLSLYPIVTPFMVTWLLCLLPKVAYPTYHMPPELPLSAKILDLKSVYRMALVHTEDEWLLGMQWSDKICVDTCFPFGLQSVSLIFIVVVDALEEVVKQQGVRWILLPG